MPINFANREIILTASIGLVSWLDPSRNARQACSTMRSLPCTAPRSAGGNRVEPFQPRLPHRRAPTGCSSKRDLRRAIERKELSMVYQPIVRLEDAEIAGFEALMRWEHPKRGSISPAEFIPIAEASDLISELGAVRLRHRRPATLMDWLSPDGRSCRSSCRSTCRARSLLNNELYNDVRAVLAKTRCEPQQAEARADRNRW